MLTVFRALASEFEAALTSARNVNPRIAEYLSDYSRSELANFRCYLTGDGAAGFLIKPDGELSNLFNVSGPGIGRLLVQAAVDRGAVKLDCFDGFLPGYYASLGWVEVDRVPNWTPGGPDVVFMAYPASATEQAA